VKDIIIKLGYAFVEFDDKHDADDAVYELNRKEFFGSRITVEHATGTPKEDLPRDGGSGDRRDRDRGYDRGYNRDRFNDRRGFRGDDRHGGGGGSGARRRPYNTEWRIIVTNLSSRVGWQDLKDYFRAAGEVTFTKANTKKWGKELWSFNHMK